MNATAKVARETPYPMAEINFITVTYFWNKDIKFLSKVSGVCYWVWKGFGTDRPNFLYSPFCPEEDFAICSQPLRHFFTPQVREVGGTAR